MLYLSGHIFLSHQNPENVEKSIQINSLLSHGRYTSLLPATSPKNKRKARAE
jgi:hypothetical protein